MRWRSLAELGGVEPDRADMGNENKFTSMLQQIVGSRWCHHAPALGGIDSNSSIGGAICGPTRFGIIVLIFGSQII